jgi:hypothetical protein
MGLDLSTLINHVIKYVPHECNVFCCLDFKHYVCVVFMCFLLKSKISDIYVSCVVAHPRTQQCVSP